ncbi:MAG: AAA family ATPase [Bacteroidia bacterium]|nr:AAA family ATPase [Bacteroidia bacterium]
MSSLFHQIIQDQLSKRGIALTTDQARVLDRFIAFYRNEINRGVFLISGAAGTGKTFFIQVISDYLRSQGWKVVLLAPTGRAAKVLTRRTRKYASTIHREIFSLTEGPGGTPSFFLKDNNDQPKTCYIVDEASMVGDTGGKGADGLLGQTLRYVFDGPSGHKLILVGDPNQLPPVGSTLSPALNGDYLSKTFGLAPESGDIREIMRQRQGSEILELAGSILEARESGKIPELEIPYGKEISVLETPYQVMDEYISNFESDNLDKVVIVTYSNFFATQINQALRAQMFDTEDILVAGEVVMVVKNNYSWGGKKFPFIANGEMGTIKKVYYESLEERYGLKWMDICIEFQDLQEEPVEIDCKVVLDLLQSKDPQLSNAVMHQVAQARRREVEELPKTRQRETLRKDPYMNALQIKYGYAITGHKAQGGQWKYVIGAFEPLYKGVEMSDYLRWTYTVITRAEEHLYLFRFPFFPKV